MYHEPVLLYPSIEGLSILKNGTYVDVTFGGGGHSREILNQLENGKLYAFDQDPDAVANTIDDTRFTLIQSNFSFIKNFLKMYKAVPVDGILADLGVSSHQFDAAERGFSTRYDGELDMRMDQNSEVDAKMVLNDYSEDELAKLFRLYGEIKNYRRLANCITTGRIQQPINTGAEFKECISDCIPKGKENKYLAQVYQAIRIEVNNEMETLKELLSQSVEVLKSGGRLAVISYHSLEDRLVKNFIKSGNFEGKIEKDFYGNPNVPLKQLSRKPIVPDESEIKRNNRARSAKMRIAEKT